MKEGQVHGDGWDIDPMLDSEATPTHRRGEGHRAKAAPSAEFGACPLCHNTRRVGLVRLGKHLVWRLHDRTMMSGAKMPCPGSGTAVCDNPSKGPGVVRCPGH
jgi:hypothetical protein